MNWQDPFDRVRNEPDPVRQARDASELMTLYRQRNVELARLRREAINRAASEQGLSFSAIAAKLGITRGRVTQIRKDAPPAERAFFGVGPVTVAVPQRPMPGRALPVISSEDSRSADAAVEILTGLSFEVQRFRIPVDGIWTPKGDCVVICGPKSSAVTARAIESDPFLAFDEDSSGIWGIRERQGSVRYQSPMDMPDGESTTDIAYVARLSYKDANMIIVAGVHAIGSVGAMDYLARHLSELYAEVSTKHFSMVVQSTHDGDTVTSSDLLVPPRVHE